MHQDQDAGGSFVAKVDAFAESLIPDEQAMLPDLIAGDNDDDVAGFTMPWPGLRIIAPGFVSTGGGATTTFKSEGAGFVSCDGGSPTV